MHQRSSAKGLLLLVQMRHLNTAGGCCRWCECATAGPTCISLGAAQRSPTKLPLRRDFQQSSSEVLVWLGRLGNASSSIRHSFGFLLRHRVKSALHWALIPMLRATTPQQSAIRQNPRDNRLVLGTMPAHALPISRAPASGHQC